jgi:hypothetical protein
MVEMIVELYIRDSLVPRETRSRWKASKRLALLAALISTSVIALAEPPNTWDQFNIGGVLIDLPVAPVQVSPVLAEDSRPGVEVYRAIDAGTSTMCAIRIVHADVDLDAETVVSREIEIAKNKLPGKVVEHGSQGQFFVLRLKGDSGQAMATKFRVQGKRFWTVTVISPAWNDTAERIISSVAVAPLNAPPSSNGRRRALVEDESSDDDGRERN